MLWSEKKKQGVCGGEGFNITRSDTARLIQTVYFRVADLKQRMAENRVHHVAGIVAVAVNAEGVAKLMGADFLELDRVVVALDKLKCGVRHYRTDECQSRLSEGAGVFWKRKLAGDADDNVRPNLLGNELVANSAARCRDPLIKPSRHLFEPVWRVHSPRQKIDPHRKVLPVPKVPAFQAPGVTRFGGMARCGKQGGQQACYENAAKKTCRHPLFYHGLTCLSTLPLTIYFRSQQKPS